jgi:hypothetical protein
MESILQNNWVKRAYWMGWNIISLPEG